MQQQRARVLWIFAPVLIATACGGGSSGGSAGGGGGGGAPSAPALVGYTNAAPIYLVGTAIAPNTPVLGAGGAPGWFEIEPALPRGLTFDTATGALAGVALEPWPATDYTVTAANHSGSSSITLTLSIPAPAVLLTADRPLVRSLAPVTAVPVTDHGSGFGTILVGPSPQWTPAPLSGLADLSPDTAQAVTDDGPAVTGDGFGHHDATAAFTARVTPVGVHVAPDAPWAAEAKNPFDSLAADLAGFDVTAAALDAAPAASELVLDVFDPAGDLDAFESAPLAAVRFTVQRVAEDLGVSDEGPIVAVGGHLAFRRVDGAGRAKLYVHSIGSGATRRALDMLPGEDDRTDVRGVFDGRVLFASLNNPLDRAQKLYTYDPASDALLSLCEIWPHQDEDTGRVVERDGELFFAASMWTNTRKLFRYREPLDAERTVALAANVSGDTGTTDAPEAVLALGDDVYFVAAPLYGGRKLYRLRTDLDVVEQVTDLRGPGADDAVEHVTAAGGRVHFVARTWEGGRKLFQFDPAAAIVRQVTDLTGDAASDDGVAELVALGDRLAFVADAAPGRRKLFVLGTGALAPTVAGHTAGSDGDDDPSGLVAHGPDLWFTARTAEGGSKLHLLRGANGALERFSDVRGDRALDDAPAHLVPFGDRLALVLEPAPGVRKLFVADAAAGWLAQIADVAGPGIDDAPRPCLVADGDLWATAAAPGGRILLRVTPPAGLD